MSQDDRIKCGDKALILIAVANWNLFGVGNSSGNIDV